MEINDIKKLTDYKWLNLFEIDFMDNEGSNNKWLMASRRKDPGFTAGKDTPDAVVIIPWHVKECKLVLLREFRVVLNDWQYAFPAGLVDEGETVESTARRELFEETGLELTEILAISPPLYSSAGLTDETISLVTAYCKGTPVRLRERSEEAETLLVSRDEARVLLQDKNAVFDVRAWMGLVSFAAAGLFAE